MTDFLQLDCQEWRDLSESFPVEMEIITEMMIESDEDLCNDATRH
jgi:hypothetical protein